jgi:pentatricopeptide repeat protein
VINNRPNEALDLLERTLFKTPIVDPLTNKVRYLKLPPASVCNKVLDSVSNVEDPDMVGRAADLAGALQLEGVIIEARTAQSIINGLAHVGMVEKGIDLLDGWLNANIDVLEDDNAAQDGPAHVMATLLEAAARADDPDAITAVLLRMARVGLSPAPHSMVALLQCFTRLGNITTAHNMLQWMRRSGIEPTAVHYAALMTMPAAVSMTGAKAQNFLQKAKEAYLDMKSHDVQATAYFYAAYINVCSRLRDLDAARDAWLDMKSDEHIEPDLVCYTTMIDACAKGGDVDGAFHLYEEMQKNGIKPDAIVFGSLISAVSLSVDKAKEIWKDMKKAGITSPDARTISVYLEVLLRAGESTDALNLLQESSASSAEQNKVKKFAGAVVGLYEQALSFAATEKLDVELLHLLIKQMKDVNVPFTTMAVTSLLTARAHTIEKKENLSSSIMPWHVDVNVESSSAGLKYKALHLSTDNILATLVESLNKETSSVAKEREFIEKTANKINKDGDGDAAAVLIGWCSVLNGESMDQAIGIYSKFSESMDRSVRIWVLKMMLAGAMATENQQHILKVVGEAREYSKSPQSGGWWWDQKTQRLIARQLKKAPEAIGLVEHGEEALYSQKLIKRPSSSSF